MVVALAPGGVAVVFDNEADSPFGRRMALRKLVTRYSRLPLAPRYYCNAAYPPLARLQKQIAEPAPLVRATVLGPDGVQRAPVVHCLHDAAPARGQGAGIGQASGGV